MDSDSLLRLATRIHYALLRHLGTGIDVGSMLSRKSYAREVIFVCVGCSDPELNTLGQEFIAAKKASQVRPSVDRKPAPSAVPTLLAEVPSESMWSLDSSGFGSSRHPAPDSRPPAAERDTAPARKGWLDRFSWRRRAPPGG